MAIPFDSKNKLYIPGEPAAAALFTVQVLFSLKTMRLIMQGSLREIPCMPCIRALFRHALEKLSRTTVRDSLAEKEGFEPSKPFWRFTRFPVVRPRPARRLLHILYSIVRPCHKARAILYRIAAKNASIFLNFTRRTLRPAKTAPHRAENRRVTARAGARPPRSLWPPRPDLFPSERNLLVQMERVDDTLPHRLSGNA